MNKVTKIGIAIMLFLITVVPNYAQDIQRVRIDFEATDGCSRQLLLGFTPNNAATDGFDYGYDGLAPDILPNDLNWIINNQRFVIQGVGSFDNTKKYPLGLYSTNTSTIKIKLNSLENFTEDIDVFVYDSLEETYTRINDTFYENLTETGEFQNRYYIAFMEPNLSSEDFSSTKNDIKYFRNSGELFFNPSLVNNIQQLTVYNIFGQQVINQSQIKSNRIKLNLNSSNSNVYIVHLKTTEGVISKKIII